ncbi:MAG: Trk system potassium transporter TrkA [Intestinibacter sp.]|uniref:Trk system potassium transporter TrkA n=1 Tax=Intestinibacter sp. TaxID=1965304 RepID=UPI0025BE6EDE|nr:Trk system potassium transporter TrkA [Intestinibacter sp.]MCI6738972.1 Trk system potassium transporter TrkA [Intestinibacter sp.]
MQIVVIGCGKVGRTLIEHLAIEGHDIVVIDNNPKNIEDIVNSYDVMGICGNGAIYDIQMEAGVNKADLFISVTSSDEVNLISCLIARELGAKNLIARVRNPDYASQISFMRDGLGISMMINPEKAAADEIARILKFPSALKVDQFAKGLVDLAEIKVRNGSKLVGVSLSDLNRKFKTSVLVCALQRQQNVYIPDGRFSLEEGDKIHITASHRDLENFMVSAGIYERKIKSAMIIGGGRIAFYLSKQLAEIGIKVKIIDNDEKTCERLSAVLPKADIIYADGTDQDVLLEEGIEHVDACVSMTGIDEENVIISMYASKCNVPKVITKVNRLSIINMLESIGIESVISPKDITANQIVRYVRAKANKGDSGIETLYKIVDKKVEAIEFIANKNVSFLGVPLKKLKTKDNLLVAGIMRGNKLIVPSGDDFIKAGDSVIIVTTNSFLTSLEDILA